MYKILTLALRDVYLTFTDRNLLLIMIASPLVLSTIIGLAFGGDGGSGSAGIRDIPIVIVNQDAGASGQTGDVNYGGIINSILNPAADSENGNLANGTCELEATNTNNENDLSLGDLFNATAIDSPELARAGVQDGTYAAAIIIPTDFSQKLTAQTDFASSFLSPSSDEEISQAEIEVYGNSAQVIQTGIVKSVVEGISNGFVTGNVAVQATIETLMANPVRLAELATVGDNPVFDVFACAFGGQLNIVQIEQPPLDDLQAASPFVQILVSIGSAQAAFFSLFTGIFGVTSIYEEMKSGTYQRLVVAPIPRWYILAGKLLGTFTTVMFQIICLMIGLTLIASIIQGQVSLIWGTNIFALVLVVVALSLAVSGVGVLMAGLAKDAQQAQVFSPIVNIILAFLGGAFGLQMPRILSQFSLIFWGSDSFTKLSTGSTDIMLNVLVLLLMGGVLFIVGSWLFSRRVNA